jgi:SAM-dependent methyltransferase
VSGAGLDQDVRATYDAFASSYDEFNHAYLYERWTGRLLDRALANGLRGDRLLDVACGTGLSSVAMLERGWQVTGCDISPEMLARARARLGEEVPLSVADMRALPVLGEFDLIWAVNDALNYLLTPAELEAALAGMRANLAPGGRIVFDVNTLTAYRNFWSGEHVVEHEDKRFLWHGGEAGEVASGALYEARFGGDGEAHTHRQRHFAPTQVMAAIEAAGLRCLDLAATVDGELDDELDEDLHTKAVYVCALA